jgi:hypothetical protein
MVLGRILSGDEAVYVFTVRLFGGDYRYAITMRKMAAQSVFQILVRVPVSPHAARIARVMKAHVGEPLEDSSALDPLIAHTIMASIQTIALQERTRRRLQVVNETDRYSPFLPLLAGLVPFYIMVTNTAGGLMAAGGFLIAYTIAFIATSYLPSYFSKPVIFFASILFSHNRRIPLCSTGQGNEPVPVRTIFSGHLHGLLFCTCLPDCWNRWCWL